MLADEHRKRVVIVDRSNEIGGDGDVPHSGTELEALAASTIAQRGVQLVVIAHGMTIDIIIKNPSLQILIGVFEEARKRKVQNTILERKGPPTFTCVVEMIPRTECRVHRRLDVTVDAILVGKLN
ncbi:hypothetical protein F2Q68_00038077 [Brassica cretica]|uniref:Uncharacterized protein n=1 Tax=Brassica cretica TaxID=69181 RepID=A0A8S9GZK5_BRACR|nr:hypothetical protein F2Q68_00038077 [Brassica cretica]